MKNYTDSPTTMIKWKHIWPPSLKNKQTNRTNLNKYQFQMWHVVRNVLNIYFKTNRNEEFYEILGGKKVIHFWFKFAWLHREASKFEYIFPTKGIKTKEISYCEYLFMVFLFFLHCFHNPFCFSDETYFLTIRHINILMSLKWLKSLIALASHW